MAVRPLRKIGCTETTTIIFAKGRITTVNVDGRKCRTQYTIQNYSDKLLLDKLLENTIYIYTKSSINFNNHGRTIRIKFLRVF